MDLRALISTETTDVGGALTKETLLKAMERFMRPPEQPPRVSRFYASHAVPYGRVYRMWTTRGELIAYVNRGAVADMPRTKIGYDNIGATLISPAVFGVPVYFE